MFVEKRKKEDNVKYYLTHKYRENGKVKSIRKYLGQNLSSEELKTLTKKTEKYINNEIERLNTQIFNFSLTKSQITQLNRYDSNLKIYHLNKKEWEKFEEEFVFNTNAIEGSTVLEKEVRNILDNKHEPKTADEMETIGLSNAVQYIKKSKEELSIKLILKLHKLCFDKTKSFAGSFRDVEIVVKNSLGDVIHRGSPKEKISSEIEELVMWYNKNLNSFKPLVLAAIIHNQFEYIHPFQDGNGRVGRLLLNFILIKNKYPPINIYLENRNEYYNCLRLYSDLEELKPTLKFLISQYKKMIQKVTTDKKIT